MSGGAILLTADGRRAYAACEVRCLVPSAVDVSPAGDSYVFDEVSSGAADAAPCGDRLHQAAGVVLAADAGDRAAGLLQAGARRVLFGEAALADPTLVANVAARFGPERVGVYVPARRLEVSWSFETASNADFKVLAPSVGAPAWEVLRADGTRSGVQALWWIGEMLKAGAGEALLRVDIDDDTDLNLCAECVERFAARVWIGPLGTTAHRLHDWARFGHARRFALPPALYAEVRAAGAALERSQQRAERAA